MSRTLKCALPMLALILSGSALEAQQPKVKLVKTRTMPWKMPNGKKTKMLLVDWKNTGTTPVRAVYADIVVLDKGGRTLMGGAQKYTIFYKENPKDFVAPGKTYVEPNGDGYVMIPIDGVPDRATVRIVEAK